MKLRLFLLLFPAFVLAQSTASPQVSTFMLWSPQLNLDRKIWVYLPKDYRGSNARYPVLYLHDGQNVFDAKTSYVGEWNVDEKLDSLNAKTIVVAVEHGGDQRIAELTPYPNAKYGGGKADAYLDFIVNTVKPEVEKRYRTRCGRKHTAIMGSSLGGLVSFYAALKYPKTFGKAGVFSPSFWFCRDSIFKLAASRKRIKSRLYFLCGDHEGDDDMVRDLDRMLALIKPKMKPGDLTATVVKGGQHNEKLWRDAFVNAYLWLKLE